MYVCLCSFQSETHFEREPFVTKKKGVRKDKHEFGEKNGI